MSTIISSSVPDCQFGTSASILAQVGEVHIEQDGCKEVHQDCQLQRGVLHYLVEYAKAAEEKRKKSCS